MDTDSDPHTGAGGDALAAEQAWRDDEPMAAIAAADRALAAGADPDGRAAAVAAAAAAADGALSEAATRWRRVAAMVGGAAAVEAYGRAALACALVGRGGAGGGDLPAAPAGMGGPPPPRA